MKRSQPTLTADTRLPLRLLVSSTNEVEVRGLVDEATGAYVNDATVEVRVYESDGVTPVAGQSWPLALAYEAGSRGNYRGALAAALALTAGQTYVVEATITGASASRLVTRTATARA